MSRAVGAASAESALDKRHRKRYISFLVRAQRLVPVQNGVLLTPSCLGQFPAGPHQS